VPKPAPAGSDWRPLVTRHDLGQEVFGHLVDLARDSEEPFERVAVEAEEIAGLGRSADRAFRPQPLELSIFLGTATVEPIPRWTSVQDRSAVQRAVGRAFAPIRT
jgi:hypothetical protein